jgi:hypothetical protein
LKYIAPFNVVDELPLIWSWQLPALEHPLRSPKKTTPASAPLIGAESVTFVCPLIVIGE